MAVSKPRIVGQPAIERRTIADQPFSPRSVGPEETGAAVDPDTGSRISVPPLVPEREGQLSFVASKDDSGLNRSYTIYAVVDISGTLTWKRVAPVPNIVNAYTGKPYDPIYDG